MHNNLRFCFFVQIKFSVLFSQDCSGLCRQDLMVYLHGNRNTEHTSEGHRAGFVDQKNSFQLCDVTVMSLMTQERRRLQRSAMPPLCSH